MPLHFTDEEFRHRGALLDQAMNAEGLDGILLFAQESMYWRTGYDTFGFCFFQCMVVPLGGEPVLLTRAPDLRQAKYTSNLQDIRIWRGLGRREASRGTARFAPGTRLGGSAPRDRARHTRSDCGGRHCGGRGA